MFLMVMAKQFLGHVSPMRWQLERCWNSLSIRSPRVFLGISPQDEEDCSLDCDSVVRPPVCPYDHASSSDPDFRGRSHCDGIYRIKCDLSKAMRVCLDTRSENHKNSRPAINLLKFADRSCALGF